MSQNSRPGVPEDIREHIPPAVTEPLGHAGRRWGIHEVSSPDELAVHLTRHRYPLCTGFVISSSPGYLFLNSARCLDSPGEYAVIKGGLMAEHRKEVERFKVGRMTLPQCSQRIIFALMGSYDHHPSVLPVSVSVEPATEHGRCQYCESL